MSNRINPKSEYEMNTIKPDCDGFQCNSSHTKRIIVETKEFGQIELFLCETCHKRITTIQRAFQSMK
jgi:hypothetical protein